MRKVKSEELVGKKIVKIDNECDNMLKLFFEDGSSIELFAECGMSSLSIPVIIVSGEDDDQED